MALTKKQVLIFLFLVMLMAGFLRLYKLSEFPPGLYPDEAMNGNNALQALREKNFKVFYPENNGREGLFINLQAFSIRFLGNEPYALRSVSAIFGILTIFAVFLLAKELFRDTRYDEQKEIIALVSSFFIAASFWHLNFSRIGFRAIMAPFFATLGFYFLLWLFRSDVGRRKKIIALSLGGLTLGAGFHSYISYRLIPFLLLIPFWFIPKLKNKNDGCFWCLFFLFLFFVFIAGIPLGFYFLEHPQDFIGRAGQVSIFSLQEPLKEIGLNIVKTFSMFWRQGDANWRHNFSGSPQLIFPVGILFAIGLIAGIKRFLRTAENREKFTFSFLFLWLAVFLTPNILSAEGVPHALRSIIVLPAVMIVSAFGLIEILNKIFNWLEKNQIPRLKKEILLLIFALFIFIGIEAFNQYFLRYVWRPETADAFGANYVLIGKWLNTLSADINKYVIINADGASVKLPDAEKNYPMPSQTVMFITNTWSEAEQKRKNIYYLLPDEIDKISCEQKCAIALLENDSFLRNTIKNKIPSLKIDIKPGLAVLINF